MSQTTTSLNNRTRWVDLATSDPVKAQEFYSRLFGWRMDVSDDPQYGGYATAMIGERSTAGIGGKQDPNIPDAWSLYIGTDDIDALSAKIADAGGTVVAPRLTSAIREDGRLPGSERRVHLRLAGVSAEPTSLYDAPNTFSWAELSARGVHDVIPFYEKVFGWTTQTSEMGPDLPPYNEFQLNGESVLGAWEMDPMVPAEVPNYWQIYFDVDHVDAAHAKAIALGATEVVPPQDFPGGRFSILTDPQGASFALLKTPPRE